ncbi:MAG: PAS domain S-box protein, partial [Elusimicrobia bacterium]|nr:PAS domain S-box protein [Elusimicrobiota bacterium]
AGRARPPRLGRWQEGEIALKDKECIAESLLCRYFPRAEAAAMVAACLAESGLKDTARISVVQLAELCDRLEKRMAGSLGTAASARALRHGRMFTARETELLSQAYGGIIAGLGLSPEELKKKVDYYRERGVLLDRHARDLQAKIDELEVSIARRKAAESALRVSEEQYRRIVDTAAEGIWVLDREGRTTFANSRMAQMLGCEAEEMPGRTMESFLPATEWADHQAWLAARRRGAVERYERRLLRKDGSVMWVIASATPILDAEGSVQGSFAMFTDITERKRVEEERASLLEAEKEARAEAEAANKAKDDFLAIVSHELRTPLTTIQGWSWLLRSGKLLPEEHGQALEMIQRGVQAQLQVVEDIIDISNLARGQFGLVRKPVDLGSVLEAACASVGQAAESRGVRIQRRFEGGIGVIADPERLRQVLRNLLHNAVKFSAAGGEVRVSLRLADGQAVVTVQDDGQGIPAEFLPHLFEPFRQKEDPVTRKHKGLGVGLAIAKRLVELHGGTVSAASEGEGRGAAITVRLPAVPWSCAEPAAARPRPAQDDLGGIRVLIVEDDADNQETLRRLLSRHGARVSIASSAAEALASLDRERPDLILCDIAMPGEDGFTLIRKLRARGGGLATMPAAALTAFAQGDFRARALDAGFQIYLTKPINPSDLVTALRDLVGEAQPA